MKRRSEVKETVAKQILKQKFCGIRCLSRAAAQLLLLHCHCVGYDEPLRQLDMQHWATLVRRALRELSQRTVAVALLMLFDATFSLCAGARKGKRE